MSSCEAGCKGRQRFCGGGGMIRHGSPALKLASLFIGLRVLFGTGATLAQCVHEDVKLTASDKAPDDGFGNSVSLSGDVSVVGVPFDDCIAGTDCGAAYVYRFDGTNWLEEQKLTASDPAQGDAFGDSVSVSGDVAVVGASGDDCAAGIDCGSAYVYRFDGIAWVEEQKLTPPDAQQRDLFGVSVSVDGNVIVIGVLFDDCGVVSNCGSAHVYRFNGSAWILEQKLVATDSASFARFGDAVSVSGAVIVAGSRRACSGCGGGDCGGSAYVFRFNGNMWVQETKLCKSEAYSNQGFGQSVSVSSNIIAVGAPSDAYCGVLCGSAFVFRFDGITWVEKEKLTACNGKSYDLFGSSVSASGDVIVAGSPSHDCPGVAGSDCGAAYVYRFDGDTWAYEAKLTASNPTSSRDNGVGASVSAGLHNVLVGSPSDRCSGAVTVCGAAYIYAVGNSLASDCNANDVPDECDIHSGGSPDGDGNCIPDECQPGACCDASTGACSDAVPMTFCVADHQTWSVNTLCADLAPPCEARVGACCDSLTGVCSENITERPCSGTHQIWSQNATCDQVTCEANTSGGCVVQKLTTHGGPEFDPYQGGAAVSVDGDVAVAGMDYTDCADGQNCGAAFVYRFNGSSWVEEQRLSPSDAHQGQGFGISVAVSGEVAVIGASGAAYVFRYSGSSWIEEQKLFAVPSAQVLYGKSVSIDGDLVVVGASYEGVGAVYVYRYNGATWVGEQKLSPADAGGGVAWFGGAVSVSGDAVLIGATGDHCVDGYSCGAAYFFRFNGARWVQEQKVTASDAAQANYFGNSVSIRGNVAVIGAVGATCGFGGFCGAAYVYRSEGSSWVEEQKLTAGDAREGAWFGYAVSVGAEVLIVGTVFQGAYVFRRSPVAPRIWVEREKLLAADFPYGGGLADSVSISGDLAMAGASSYRCAYDPVCGVAYLFDLSAACTGACCDLATGVCTPDVPGGECDSAYFVWTRETSCAATGCEVSIGDCCDESNGHCEDWLPAVACTGDHRSWHVNTLCAELDPPCNMRTGACCDFRTGICRNGLPLGLCSDGQQRWVRGASCADVGCAGDRADVCAVQTLPNPEGVSQQYFGRAVAIDGDVAIAGSTYPDCAAGPYCGAAYVYRFNANGPEWWVQEETLRASDAAANAYFGGAVSISGDVAVVGAYGADCYYCGAAYVFRYNGASWIEEQKLLPPVSTERDYFGGTVSVDGDVAVIGASGEDCDLGPDCGAAYVYRFDGSTWSQEAKLVASNVERENYFGRSVSVSGDVIVVAGGHGECANGRMCGAALVYRYNGTSWVEEFKLLTSEPSYYYTVAVSVSGDVALVGASQGCGTPDVPCTNAFVYRYHPGAAGTWVMEQMFGPDDPWSAGPFGFEVSIDGDWALVGAPGDSCGSPYSCGAAYAFRFNGRTWVQDWKLTGDLSFGASVAVSGERVMVGETDAHCDAGYGCVHAFALGPDCNFNGDPDLCEIRAGVSADADANGIPDECETGSCCDASTGHCTDALSMALCTGGLRSWHVSTRCTELDPPCTAYYGACCDLFTGICTGSYPYIACTGEQQTWTVGASCKEVACEPVTGSCCDHDPFGGCTDGLTRAECNCGRCEWSKLASCEDVECPRDSIPTVGAWGLAILTLLLMTGAKIRFGRGTRATAP